MGQLNFFDGEEPDLDYTEEDKKRHAQVEEILGKTERGEEVTVPSVNSALPGKMVGRVRTKDMMGVDWYDPEFPRFQMEEAVRKHLSRFGYGVQDLRDTMGADDPDLQDYLRRRRVWDYNQRNPRPSEQMQSAPADRYRTENYVPTFQQQAQEDADKIFQRMRRRSEREGYPDKPEPGYEPEPPPNPKNLPPKFFSPIAQSDAFNPMTYAPEAPFGEHAITPADDVRIMDEKIRELYHGFGGELSPEELERRRKMQEQRDEEARKRAMNEVQQDWPGSPEAS